MKSLLRALAILVVSCGLGLAVYTAVQPMSPAVSFAAEGNPATGGGAVDAAAGSGAQGDLTQLQSASGDDGASTQAYRGGRAQGGLQGGLQARPAGGGPGVHPRGGSSLVTVLLVLAKFALAFLFIVIARFLLRKIAPKRAEA